MQEELILPKKPKVVPEDLEKIFTQALHYNKLSRIICKKNPFETAYWKQGLSETVSDNSPLYYWYLTGKKLDIKCGQLASISQQYFFCQNDLITVKIHTLS